MLCSSVVSYYIYTSHEIKYAVLTQWNAEKS